MFEPTGVSQLKMIFLGLVISMLELAGCGGSKAVPTKNASNPPHPVNSDKQSERKVDACSLLTKTDAESFLGEPVAEPTTSHTEAMGNIVTQCRYSSTSGQRVGLLARQATTSEQAAKVFREARETAKELSGAAPQVVSGLGDDAYWTGGSLKQLNVLKTDVWLIITASPGNGIDHLEASKDVARRMLAHIP